MKSIDSSIKRGLDIVIALLSLPVVIVFIIVAGVVIRIETPGSIFFKQERVGRNKRPFYIYKLRTMVQDAVKMGSGFYTEQILVCDGYMNYQSKQDVER